MQNLHIRPADLEDCHAIASIYNEHIRKGESTMEHDLKSATDIESWLQSFNEREQIHCLELNGVVMGWGIIKRYSDRKGYQTTCETAVYLRSENLRMGLGTKMKVALIEKCKMLGYRHLVAKILATNIASVEYNKKLGYEMVGTQKEVGKSIDGKWVDVTIMQLIL